MDLMLVFLLGVAVAVGAMGWLRRRQTPPPEDEWVLPPAQPGEQALKAKPLPPGYSQPTAQAASTAPAAATPVFDRDTLLNRSKTFDPRGWDDSADAEGGDDLPRFYDRDYLEKRERGERSS